MDKDGLTQSLGKKGRLITQKGMTELSHARVIDKVGFLAAKIDQMTYMMDFDLSSKQGAVVTNVSIVEKARLKKVAPLIEKVFEAGYAMGRLMSLIQPGEQVGKPLSPKEK